VRERAPLAAVFAALALAACGGAKQPALHLSMRKVSHGTCPVTAPLGTTQAPRRLQALAGAHGAARSFGKGGLWVLLPIETAPNAVPVSAGLSIKVPWYLNGSGDLKVVGERLDGSGHVDYDAYDVPGPGPRMEASSLTVSAPGCYGIKAEHHGQVITWVFETRVDTD
jgi:hypothetical protein